MLRLYKFSPNILEKEIGEFDSKYCYIMAKIDHNIGFQEKRHFLISPKNCENRQKVIICLRVARWYIFIPTCVYFWGPWNEICWYILWPFGILHDHLVYVMAIWYTLHSFGIFFPFWFIVPRKIWQPWYVCVLFWIRNNLQPKWQALVFSGANPTIFKFTATTPAL
jgi:hypothetical protein